MTDRETEKVLQGLYCCAANCQNGCPYSDISQYCSDVLAKDALELIKELLKAREPIIPVEEEFYDVTTWHCGACGEDLLWGNKYCSRCGRAVKWDE